MFDDWELLDAQHSASLIQWSQQQVRWKFVKKNLDKKMAIICYTFLHANHTFVVPLH